MSVRYMRIAFTAPRFHMNQRGLIKGLQRQGHEVHFLALQAGKSEQHDVLQPRIMEISQKMKDRAFRLAGERRRQFLINKVSPSWRTLMTAMREIRPDVVVVRNPTSAYGRAAVLASQLVGAKTVLYVQTPQYVSRITWRHKAQCAVARLLQTAWITPVRFRGLTQPLLRVPCIHFVPFAAEVEPGFQREPREPGQPLRLLSVGKYIPRKNHLTLVELLHTAPWRNQVHLSLVGESTAPDHELHLQVIRQRVRELGLEGHVTVNVNIPAAEMPSVYARHDVMLFFASDERAAFSPIEAAAHGLYVIIGPDAGTTSYFSGVTGGVMVEDEEQLGHAVRRALDVGSTMEVRDVLFESEKAANCLMEVVG